MSNTLTNEFIKELIGCEKKIISTPSPKNKTNGKHKETGIQVQSLDNKYRFSVFIREHADLMEFFSVGLVYWPDSGTPIIIARYNGNHGKHKNFLTKEIIDGFHIHILKEEALEAGVKGENTAEVTDKYATVKQAMNAFFTDFKVTNFHSFFPELLQTMMF